MRNDAMRRLLLSVLGLILMAGLAASAKRRDPAVANAGGGAAIKRNVLTMQGAAR